MTLAPDGPIIKATNRVRSRSTEPRAPDRRGLQRSPCNTGAPFDIQTVERQPTHFPTSAQVLKGVGLRDQPRITQDVSPLRATGGHSQTSPRAPRPAPSPTYVHVRIGRACIRWPSVVRMFCVARDAAKLLHTLKVSRSGDYIIITLHP